MAPKIEITEYPHFQIYYDLYHHDFKNPADALVLFYHWLLIHNRFKCFSNGKKTEYLPSEWNMNFAKKYYDLAYTKHDENYRLEIYLIGNLLQINFKRLCDAVCCVQQYKLSDYVNESDFKNSAYHNTYKLDKLEYFYKRLKAAIESVKKKTSRLKSTSRTNSTCSEISTCATTSKTSGSNNQLFNNEKVFSYLDIVQKIKEEKKSYDSELESLYASSIRSSISTSSKESQKKKKEKAPVLTEENVEKSKSKVDHYVYNPIVNYYNTIYNKDVTTETNHDMYICKTDENIRKLFEKNNLKYSSVPVVDCLKDGILKGMKAPFILSKEIKEALRIPSGKEKNRRERYKHRNKQNRRKKRQRHIDKNIIKRDVEEMRETELLNRKINSSSNFEKNFETLNNTDSSGLPDLDVTNTCFENKDRNCYSGKLDFEMNEKSLFETQPLNDKLTKIGSEFLELIQLNSSNDRLIIEIDNDEKNYNKKNNDENEFWERPAKRAKYDDSKECHVTSPMKTINSDNILEKIESRSFQSKSAIKITPINAHNKQAAEIEKKDSNILSQSLHTPKKSNMKWFFQSLFQKNSASESKIDKSNPVKNS